MDARTCDTPNTASAPLAGGIVVRNLPKDAPPSEQTNDLLNPHLEHLFSAWTASHVRGHLLRMSKRLDVLEELARRADR